MHPTRSDDACPVCGEAYATMVVVSRGADWRDIFAGRPLEYYRRYARRCSSTHNVEADRPVGRGHVAVYFHDADGRVGLLS